MARRPIAAAAAAGLGAGLLLVAGVLLGAAPAAAAGPSGCAYGTGGSQAGAICWLDMSGYDETQAASAGGQQLGVSLPGGYHVSFTVHTGSNGTLPYRSLKATSFPTWSGAYLGNRVYTNAAGKPALYGTANGGGTLMTLDDIKVTNSADQPVSSYGFIVADAESSDAQESITFQSDKSLTAVYPASSQYPYCTGGLTGLGSATVTCVGGPHPNGPNGAIALQANGPTRISAALRHGGIQGVAFAVVTANVKLTKTVDGRVNPSDSFDIAVSQGGASEAAVTGSANSVTTAPMTVLSTDPITLSDEATPGSGTDLGAYAQSWSCTNSATSSSTDLPSGAGTSKQLSLEPGDDVACTVTNTAPDVVDTPIGDVKLALGLTVSALVGGSIVLGLRRRQAAEAGREGRG